MKKQLDTITLGAFVCVGLLGAGTVTPATVAGTIEYKVPSIDEARAFWEKRKTNWLRLEKKKRGWHGYMPISLPMTPTGIAI
ncbi:hypothetical protein [Flexibacterium corallicola]|uniref:hypothetical protein n=1 Tax=Flexibacterium corallicola TaxID=3037259 RepID=UPI00286F9A4B|nr:hypothetical protein [Pseudovibrio sp. M1P-2-3]